jgi:hypothetical protein
MLSMRERVPLCDTWRVRWVMRADALEMYARLMIRRLRPAVFIKMLLYHFIGKFLVASRPKRHRLAQIYLLRLGAGCRDSSLFQFT